METRQRMSMRAQVWLLIVLACALGAVTFWKSQSAPPASADTARAPTHEASRELVASDPVPPEARRGAATVEGAVVRPDEQPTLLASVDHSNALPALVTMLSEEDTRLPEAKSAVGALSFNPDRKTFSELELQELDGAIKELQSMVDESRQRAFAARDEHADMLFATGQAETVPAGSKYPGSNVDPQRSPGHTSVLHGGANGSSGVQFNALEVPAVHAALTDAQTQYAAGIETVKDFISKHGH